MDNKQQLSDYISQELKNGKSPEDIKSTLISNGWSKEDIDVELSSSAQISSAGNSINEQQRVSTQNSDVTQSVAAIRKAPYLQVLDNLKSKKKLALVVGVVIFILFILTVLVLSINPKPKTSSINKPTSMVSISVSETGMSEPTKKAIAGNVIDCGDSMSCFIQASVGCREAKLLNSITLDMFDIKQTTTSKFEIRGTKEDKCQFYLKTENIDVVFPPEIPSEIIDEQKLIYSKLEGKEGICLFDVRDLTEVILRWDKGEFDSGRVSCEFDSGVNKCTIEGGDFSKASCTGSYFEQLSQNNLQ